MWRNLNKIFTDSINTKVSLLCPDSVVQQQLRTTAILKRRHPPRLHRKNMPPKPLRSRNYIYDLIRIDDTITKPNIEVILTTHVEGLGNKGDKVSVAPYYAYDQLLLPGLAVYVTPENMEKYQNPLVKTDQTQHSSPYSAITMGVLSRSLISIVMNKENSWVIQPWHIKVSLRKCGLIAPEEAITIPSEPIKGPDMNLEGKEFHVTVTINNFEKVKVRCRIHHWSTSLADKLPFVPEFWKQTPELIFAEQNDVLPPSSQSNNKHT